MDSATPGRLSRSSSRNASTKTYLPREGLLDTRDPVLDDPHLLLERRVADPEIQTPPLERVAELPHAVRGHDDVRDALGIDHAQLWDRDLILGQHLEEERLELLVRPVDLVDEQHGALPRMAEGL